MNWIDFIIIGVIIFYLLEGLAVGFIRGVFDFLGFILSFALALKFYSITGSLLAANFSLPHGIANAVGFFLAAAFLEFVFAFIFSMVVAKIPRALFTNPTERLLGILPALASAVVLIAFFLTLVLTLPLSPQLKNAIGNSQISQYLTRETAGLERFVKQVFGQAVNETINFTTIKPGGRETVDLKFQAKNLSPDATSEQQMFNLVNQARAAQGVKPLLFDDRLREVARAHAKDMFMRGYFSHYTPEGLSPFDRMAAANISFNAAGENLAYAPNVTLAHDGLMKSPGHRANILSGDFGKVGIGVIDGGIYGKMFVQEFTD
ncbi:CvpA family protein [Candidatus Microgenomates bacterium]|nr:CvpA family protein [Candidatus Microgenomates bacterium]MBI2622380.1 CvpA family protein [Candidatus Microgenomates bacterium]